MGAGPGGLHFWVWKFCTWLFTFGYSHLDLDLDLDFEIQIFGKLVLGFSHLEICIWKFAFCLVSILV